MNGCESRKCKFWTGTNCADPVEWVDSDDEDCCRYRSGARLKVDVETLTAERDTLRAELATARAEVERVRKALQGLEDGDKFECVNDCENVTCWVCQLRHIRAALEAAT